MCINCLSCVFRGVFYAVRVVVVSCCCCFCLLCFVVLCGACALFCFVSFCSAICAADVMFISYAHLRVDGFCFVSHWLFYLLVGYFVTTHSLLYLLLLVLPLLSLITITIPIPLGIAITSPSTIHA